MLKRKSIGLPPGTVSYTGSKHHLEVYVNYMSFTEEGFKEELQNSESTFQIHPNILSHVQWYDIRGLHNSELIERIGETYGIHTVILENAVDVYQRPIYHEFEGTHFISLKHIALSKDLKVEWQTVSICFGEGYVITFQEDEDDLLASIRSRIRNKTGRIRSKKSDYLAYAIIDVIVDDYFIVLDSIEEQTELLEEKISNGFEFADKAMIYRLKKQLLAIRKSIVPLREAINQLGKSDSILIEERTQLFVRDVFDHVIQITENVVSLREILSGLQDLYNSEVSLKMNKIMQFFTVVTAIFVPISFLTGLYGMNFENMPELKVTYGYYILLGFMILSTIIMLIWIKKKNWL